LFAKHRVGSLDAQVLRTHWKTDQSSNVPVPKEQSGGRIRRRPQPVWKRLTRKRDERDRQSERPASVPDADLSPARPHVIRADTECAQHDRVARRAQELDMQPLHGVRHDSPWRTLQRDVRGVQRAADRISARPRDIRHAHHQLDWPLEEPPARGDVVMHHLPRNANDPLLPRLEFGDRPPECSHGWWPSAARERSEQAAEHQQMHIRLHTSKHLAKNRRLDWR
jgi:hypothetical protein